MIFELNIKWSFDELASLWSLLSSNFKKEITTEEIPSLPTVTPQFINGWVMNSSFNKEKIVQPSAVVTTATNIEVPKSMSEILTQRAHKYANEKPLSNKKFKESLEEIKNSIKKTKWECVRRPVDILIGSKFSWFALHKSYNSMEAAARSLWLKTWSNIQGYLNRWTIYKWMYKFEYRDVPDNQ